MTNSKLNTTRLKRVPLESRIRTTFYFTVKLICLILILAMACTDYCPGDRTGPPFNDTDLAWFSFVEGDTVFYRDYASGDIFYLLCANNEISTKTEFILTEDCASGGYNSTVFLMTNSFESNFPHFDDTNLMLEMEVGKGTCQTNIRMYLFYGELWYTYLNQFNDEDESIQALYPGRSEARWIENVQINGREYENVYAIRWIEDTTRDHFAYYDSLYFSRDGFLKFISSQYGYVLERLP